MTKYRQMTTNYKNLNIYAILVNSIYIEKAQWYL